MLPLEMERTLFLVRLLDFGVGFAEVNDDTPEVMTMLSVLGGTGVYIFGLLGGTRSAVLFFLICSLVMRFLGRGSSSFFGGTLT